MDENKIEELLKVDLFEELNLQELSDDERRVLLEDMSKVIIQGILLKIVESLSLEKQNELTDLFNKAAVGEIEQEVLINFLYKEIPHLDDLIKEEIAHYKSLLISNLKENN